MAISYGSSEDTIDCHNGPLLCEFPQLLERDRKAILLIFSMN